MALDPALLSMLLQGGAKPPADQDPNAPKQPPIADQTAAPQEPSFMDKMRSKMQQLGSNMNDNEKGKINTSGIIGDQDPKAPPSPMQQKMQSVLGNMQKNEKAFGGLGASPSAVPNDGGLTKTIGGQDWSANKHHDVAATKLVLGQSPSEQDQYRKLKLMSLKKLTGAY